jgi:hypothetical protein
LGGKPRGGRMLKNCTMAKIFALTLVLGGFASFDLSDAASNTEEYELQERCGKQAKEFFQRKYGDGVFKTKDGQQEIDYSNHYSKKFNKCFVQITTNNVRYKNKMPEVVTSFEILILNISENKEYGRFVNIYSKDKPALCRVANESCHDILEWEALIKPYMEE